MVLTSPFLDPVAATADWSRADVSGLFPQKAVLLPGTPRLAGPMLTRPQPWP